MLFDKKFFKIKNTVSLTTVLENNMLTDSKIKALKAQKKLYKVQDWDSVNILDTFWEKNLKTGALQLLDPFYEIVKWIL